MQAPRVLSLIPPMTQLNTPYPSTAYLTGFLRSRGVDAVQDDLALALVLKLFSRDGLAAIKAAVAALPPAQHSDPVASFAALHDRYTATIEPVIAFLQGQDSTLASRIVTRRFLPEGPRFASLDVYVDDDGGDPLAWAFGALGVHDRARHLATLYLNDLADVLRDAVDPRFEFVRYAEKLAASQPSFDGLASALAAPRNLVDDTLHQLALGALALNQHGQLTALAQSGLHLRTDGTQSPQGGGQHQGAPAQAAGPAPGGAGHGIGVRRIGRQRQLGRHVQRGLAGVVGRVVCDDEGEGGGHRLVVKFGPVHRRCLRRRRRRNRWCYRYFWNC